MAAIVTSLLPVFALIALGAACRRAGFPGDAAWPHLERFTYWILFPPLLFSNIVASPVEQGQALTLAAAFLAAVMAMAAILFALRPILPISGAAYSSVFQGSIRWNGFVALGLVSTLYGPPGVALAAVAFATLVPTVNVLSVLVLSRYAGDAPAPLRSVAVSLATNPLILACAAGIAVAASGLGAPAPLLQTLKMLGDATVPLGLICVGAALDFRALKGAGVPVAATMTLKLFVMPGLMAAACAAMGIEGLALSVAIVCASVPGATSSYILARQLGGDATLMANLITASTLVSALTMPAMIALLG